MNGNLPVSTAAKPIMIGLLLVAAFPHFGLADRVDECIKGKGQSQIEACTTIIKTGLHRGKPITMDNLPAIYVYRGTARGKQNDYDGALADFAKAIKLDPKLTMAWGDRGKFYNANARFEQAIADFSQALKLNPKFDAAYAGLGYAWFHLGYEEKAIKAYSKAIALAPFFQEYYYARANVYMEEYYSEGKFLKGHRKKLLADLHKVLKMEPSHKGAKRDLKTLEGK